MDVMYRNTCKDTCIQARAHPYVYRIERERERCTYTCIYYMFTYEDMSTHIHTYIHTYKDISPVPLARLCSSESLPSAGADIAAADAKWSARRKPRKTTVLASTCTQGNLPPSCASVSLPVRVYYKTDTQTHRQTDQIKMWIDRQRDRKRERASEIDT